VKQDEYMGPASVGQFSTGSLKVAIQCDALHTINCAIKMRQRPARAIQSNDKQAPPYDSVLQNAFKAL